MAALHVQRIAVPGGAKGVVLRLGLSSEISSSVVLVDALHHARAQFLALEAIDGIEKRRPVARNLLRGMSCTARHHNGGAIVRAEPFLDERSNRALHEVRAKHVRMKVVEDEDVQAAIERLPVRRDIGRQPDIHPWRRGERNLDGCEDLNRLAGTVLEQFEVVARQVRDGIAVLVEDANVDVNCVYAGSECPRVALNRGLLRLNNRSTKQDTDKDRHFHTHRENLLSSDRASPRRLQRIVGVDGVSLRDRQLGGGHPPSCALS
jgi:hypothetical protein